MNLKKKDFDNFKALLLEEKVKLLRHLEDIENNSEITVDVNSGDLVDIASLEIAQASLQKIGKREKHLLSKIMKALEKIEDKSYGECENCGEFIGIPRLQARPVAEYCIDCKTEMEVREKKFSSKDPEEGDSVGDGGFGEEEEG